MSHPLIPAKPAEITLETLPELFAHHKARFGGWSMTQTPPEPTPPAQPTAPTPPAEPVRPDGVTEADWAALGDPGKRAIVRERERADAAERALAASRARPTPPKAPEQPTPPAPAKAPEAPKPAGDDVEAMIRRAVEAAVAPFQQAEQTRQAETAAGRVRDAVVEAAKARLHDATDALAHVDLTTVINEHGQVDDTKVKTALDDLVARKPHLAKSQLRVAPIGIGGGAPAATTEGERVAAVLADMQRATGVRAPAATNTH